MLNDSPVVRSHGPRILFLLGAIVTAAILLWMHGLRQAGGVPGLTTIFYVLFAFEDYGSTVCALLILGAAVFVAGRIPARRVLRAAGEHPGTIAAVAAVVLGAGALGVYHDHPLSMDEYAAYFQSQVFAAGHLTGRLPLPQLDWLIPPGFQNFFLSVSPTTGEVASAYWPAHALIMAPFTALGIPWACNPLLSALTVLVIHRLALHLFADVEAAGLAVLLTVASPVFFGIGISYYSMPAHLFTNSLFALLLVRPSPVRALAAGVVGSIALCLHNPVPHMLFAAPWLVWIATRPGGLKLLALMGAGYLPLCSLLGVGWFEFTNHLRDAAANAAGHSNALERLTSLLSVFSAPTATVLLARGIGVAKVWVWAVPGLLILAVCAAVRWRHNRLCQLLAASALTTFIGYIFVPPDQGHGWGYRYFHSAWLTLPLLATAALFRPVGPGGEPRAGAGPARSFEDDDSRAYVTACILLSLVFGVGYRAWEMQEFMAYDLNQLPHYAGTGRRVVILDPELMFYGGDLVQNDPWLRGNEIRMMSHGVAADRQLMAQYYPDMHQVFADHHGWVWSAKPR
ncbi:MAG TPA: hypothetical protein VMC02_08285 [Steroidobacteraceae bacterium]|nr:hypothetical protein [Steroidobacteraceae bacterium]